MVDNVYINYVYIYIYIQIYIFIIIYRDIHLHTHAWIIMVSLKSMAPLPVITAEALVSSVGFSLGEVGGLTTCGPLEAKLASNLKLVYQPKWQVRIFHDNTWDLP